ncbi:IclR family transcriptional regulator [Cryobacterium sp. SO1]|uniref:IclR family transcriptional regulator n=1 Tax=Cryobacterium sp. SO1 TaxID=1897061 RepID=UPI0013EE74AC
MLAVFESGHARLALSGIARHAQLPITTAQRLLAELVEWGALERVGNSYMVGKRLWCLGMVAPVQRDITEVASPFMQDIFFATQHSVNLFVIDDGEALLVDRVAGTRSGKQFLRVGERLPLHASAAGKVLLAFGGSDLVKSLPMKLPQSTSKTLSTRRALEVELEQIRVAGFAVSHEESGLGKYAVAVPVLEPGLGAVAAMGVITEGEPPALGSIVPVLRTAANGVGRGLPGNYQAEIVV